MWQPLFPDRDRGGRTPITPCDQRCPRPDVALAADAVAASTATSATAGWPAPTTRDLGGGRRHPRRRAVGGPVRGPPPPGRALAGAGAPRTGCAAARTSTTSRRPSTGSTRTASPSASPAGSPPTSGSTCCRSGPSGRCACSRRRPAAPVRLRRQGPPARRGGQAHRARPVPAEGRRRRSPTRVAFLEDYDLAFAAELVAGCDVWVNVPRPPEEASGTSGMKVGAQRRRSTCRCSTGGGPRPTTAPTAGPSTATSTPTPRPRTSATPTPCSTSSSTRSCPLFHDRDDAGLPTPVAGDGARQPADQRSALLGHPHGPGVRHPHLPPAGTRRR